MSYPDSCTHRFVTSVLFNLLLITNFTLLPRISTAAPIPDCNKIIPWAAAAYEKDKNIKSGNYWGGTYQGYKYQGKYFLSGFIDENFKPAFGVTFDQWNRNDLEKFAVMAKKCYQSSKKASFAAYKKRKYKLVGLFNGASGYIGMLGIMTPANRVDSYDSIMSHQKNLYREFKKARTIKNRRLEKAKTMRATKANIKKLYAMAKDPQFVYLHANEKRNYEIILQNHRVRLADKLVENAVEKFNDFAENLDGLKKILAYRQQLQTDLQTIKSSKWNTFEQAYKTRTYAIATKAGEEAIAALKKFPATYSGLKKLNAYQREVQTTLGRVRNNAWPAFLTAYTKILRSNAITAIDDFTKSINALPATSKNLREVQTTVNNLFRLRNPSNMKVYQTIANERSRAMKQEIRKVSCYKQLDSTGLAAKARDVALLGSKGETTLGLFVCAINKRGNKFQEYKSAGIFSSTYTLNLLNQRGITLTIEMKKVEAVKGKKMLVGVLVKDATSSTKLTLDGWQDYVARLAGNI